jgi:hypothetical protein
MDQESKFWLGTLSIIAITLMTIVISALLYNYSVEKLAFENGYQKVMGIGSNIPYYNKVTEVE